jgi:hypothetical protein
MSQVEFNPEQWNFPIYGAEWPTNYGKWCAITTNGSPILIMEKLDSI